MPNNPIINYVDRTQEEIAAMRRKIAQQRIERLREYSARIDALEAENKRLRATLAAAKGNTSSSALEAEIKRILGEGGAV